MGGEAVLLYKILLIDEGLSQVTDPKLVSIAFC